MNNKKLLAIRYAALSDTEKLRVSAELSQKELAELHFLVSELEETIMKGRSVSADFYPTVLVELETPQATELSGWNKFVATSELSTNKIPVNLLSIINEVVGVDKSEHFYERK